MNRPHHLAPAKESLRILFAYKNFAVQRGISHIGLGVSHMHTANTLRRNGIWTRAIPIVSAADLRQQIDRQQFRAASLGEVGLSHVVLAALWLTPAEIHRLVFDFPDVDFVVTSHSNCGFLAAEPTAVGYFRSLVGLQLATPNFHVVGNCRRFATWASHAFGHRILCLPNLYNSETFKMPRRHAWKTGVLKIGCFGALRSLKNSFTAAAATLELAERLGAHVEFHVNRGRGDERILRPIAALFGDAQRVQLVPHDWQAWPDFRATVSRMDLMLQPSYTESFNLVTADGVAEGVPSVVSDAIDWCPKRWIACADCAHEIATTAIALLNDPSAPHDGQQALRDYVTRGLKDWHDFLLTAPVAEHARQN